ncbi:hypothetical protein ACFXAZ_38135 [Streptomyces sp. NPDC059477]|uniref:hypothetical protein n=1 Tax=Streptomyces sp. NPDC059477 TaxID=3346847 RepID=UPI003684A9CA
MSRIPEVIAALVALARADPAFAPGGDSDGVTVADGPEVTDDAAPDWLIVGFDGDPTGDFEAAQSAAEAVGLGTSREEQFQITVAAVANRGDDDVVAARARAAEIGERVTAWLRESPSLGLDGLEAGIGGTRLVLDQTEQGAQARVLLTVAGRGFI